MDEAFEVSEGHAGDACVVTVVGEVDVATAPALRECLDGVFEHAGGAVVVDLLGVTFIDSTGLGVLIGTQRRCADSGLDLRLVIEEPRILKVFEITGLTDLFAIVPSLQRATGDGVGR